MATTLATLARTDASLGDYVSAHEELDRAVEIQTKIGGPNHPYVAGFLTELAAVYRDQGLPERALPLLERALALRERHLGSAHRDVARTLADTASTLVALGRTRSAGELVRRAEAIWLGLDAPDAPDHASVLVLAAQIDERLGHHAAAKAHFERALSVRGRVDGASHPLYAATELGLAGVLASLREDGAAFTAASTAEATGRSHARLMMRSLPERQALILPPPGQPASTWCCRSRRRCPTAWRRPPTHSFAAARWCSRKWRHAATPTALARPMRRSRRCRPRSGGWPTCSRGAPAP